MHSESDVTFRGDEVRAGEGAAAAAPVAAFVFPDWGVGSASRRSRWTLGERDRPGRPPGFSPSPSAPPWPPSRRSGLSPPGASTHASDPVSKKHQSTIPKPAQDSFCCLVKVLNHFTSFTFAFSSALSAEDSLLDLAPALV